MITVDDWGCGGEVHIYREGEKVNEQIGRLENGKPILFEGIELTDLERVELNEAITLYNLSFIGRCPIIFP